MSRTLLRPALLGAAVLGLLALVALGSRADRPARPEDAGDRTLPLEFWDYLLTFGLLAIVATIALAAYLKVPVRAPGGRFGFSQLLAIAVIAGLVTLAGTRYEWPTVTHEAGVEEAIVGEKAQTTTLPRAEEPQPDRSRPLRFRWEVFVAAAGLVLLAAALLMVRRRRATSLRRDHADAATALSAAVTESVDDLRAEPDPRRAVIAAYARMERVLERHGFPRFRAEAPLEYLARVLRELSVRSSAVLALTELFERAKFSRHAIDAEMKEEAIGALVAVREDLQVQA